MEFGSITFGTSVDCEFATALVDALEELDWADETDVWKRLNQSPLSPLHG